MEPFQDPSELDNFRRKLGFDNAGVNCSGKIWFFWISEWEGINILDTVQQVTIKFKIDIKFLLISVVYARCNALERLELWEELERINDRDRCPWIIGGDFNVILNEEEKLGGLPFTQHEAIDFASFICMCALSEVHTIGSNITWWNGQIEEECIFKRLDRILVIQEFEEVFPSSETPQKFQEDCGRKQEGRFCGESVHRISSKDEKAKKALAGWSKEVFGNVFQQIATIEDVIKVKGSSTGDSAFRKQ
ncbi:uncharacterized protein LOC107001349 [Solanum pennellii]|uniref:Uncharacterized protein LOC107001349 n=1 Tax=Solanum pennellii TaxID=28526 RepID=A0ABM1FCI1_SOLPN|nr:uncharacterized protein LOC107001349 [Solanum pennellii]